MFINELPISTIAIRSLICSEVEVEIRGRGSRSVSGSGSGSGSGRGRRRASYSMMGASRPPCGGENMRRLASSLP